MQVKVIRKQRNFYTLFFALSSFPAVWLGVIAKTEAAIAIGAISVVFLILLIKKSRLLYDATLIWDNRILAVSSALISTTGGTGQSHTEETVVSTFGILIGAKIFRWGLDGVHGVRLSSIEIDRQRMILIFGDATRSMRIELLHGMTDQSKILTVKQKFWSETGVSANIDGW
ncbi:MAG TPA: hypothetical protein PLD22_06890 [Bacillota bacterium]|nr:hypothetical protein [Bacillota bacterium]